MRKIFLLLGVCIILSGCAFSLGCSVRLFGSSSYDKEKYSNESSSCSYVSTCNNNKCSKIISCDDGTSIIENS